MTDRFLTIKDVAKMLSVTPLTLRNWDRKGLLVAYRNPANNYRLYRNSDVLKFIDAIHETAVPISKTTARIKIKREETTETTEEATPNIAPIFQEEPLPNLASAVEPTLPSADVAQETSIRKLAVRFEEEAPDIAPLQSDAASDLTEVSEA